MQAFPPHRATVPGFLSLLGDAIDRSELATNPVDATPRILRGWLTRQHDRILVGLRVFQEDRSLERKLLSLSGNSEVGMRVN